ncbi:MAG: hypothetical protein ACUVX9_16880, partial [Anaerolineae bacterium]
MGKDSARMCAELAAQVGRGVLRDAHGQEHVADGQGHAEQREADHDCRDGQDGAHVALLDALVDDGLNQARHGQVGRHGA